MPDSLSRNLLRCVTATEADEVDELPTLLLSMSDIAELQKADNELKEIRVAVLTPDKVTNAIARGARSYIMEDEVLYRKNVGKNSLLLNIIGKMLTNANYAAWCTSREKSYSAPLDFGQLTHC